MQIQNAGTIGGNLCNASPAADGVPPLLALDAEVELASAAGTRRLPLAAFLHGPRRTARRPDELLTAVLIPAAATEGRSAFLKLGARRYLVISIAMVAARLATADGRVTAAALAVGACGPVATRLPAVEAALVGHPPDPSPHRPRRRRRRPRPDRRPPRLGRLPRRGRRRAAAPRRRRASPEPRP